MVMLKRLRLKWKNIEIDGLGFSEEFQDLKFRIQNNLLSLPTNNNWRRGRAARLGSAKAPTPVRIRTMPLKPSKQFEGFFVLNF